MKTKVIFLTQNQLKPWIETSNLFAKSLISSNEALKQFNRLSATQRSEILHQFERCDEVRRKNIPKGEATSWELSVMVDSHIIATEHDIDPLTAVMCINPPCRANEKVYISGK